MQIFGQHEDTTIAQLRDVASRAARVALMADGHLGYVMPIGGVAAYRNQISVVGVGFDIACGNCAIRTDLTLASLEGQDRAEIADEIARTISFGLGRTNQNQDAPVDHPLFASSDWEAIPRPVRNALREKARVQLGTVGSGNHYVDVFADESGVLWVGVHFGSRGFGHGVASGFLSLSQGAQWGARVPEQEMLLDLDDELGQRYWRAMHLAGEYAYAGREYVARKVVELLGGTALDLVHNHHNYGWLETHDGDEYVVVRKGATPAFPGQRGFIGGSMGDDAVIVRGTEPEALPDDERGVVDDLQRRALYSTVHGAGRVMSRSQAKGSRPKRDGRARRPGQITRQMMHEWVSRRDIVVRGGDVDESPHVYRRLDEVLAAQGPTIEILHRLRPLIVVMAGAKVVDPYKD